MEAQQRIVALAVGDKRAEDTRYMHRYCYAHILEPNDRVVVLHVRIGAPAGWVPLTVGQAVGSDEAGWLPEEMRQGLKSFASAEYWSLRGLSAAEAIIEFALITTHATNNIYVSLPHLAPCAVETRGVRPDLLVVGSRGDGGMKRMLTGSTSASIVAAVNVPICVVRVPIFVQDSPPFRLPTPAGAELATPLPRSDRSRQIAIAVDGSPTSGVLVRWAAQTLLRGSDNVVLLHAPYGLDEFHTLAAAGAIVDCEAMLARFFRAAEQKQPPPSQMRTLRLAADVEPREALVAAVEAEGPFDMMLVGSRGMGALKRAAAGLTGHGSVSSHLIAHAPCPVLVVSRSALLAWVEEAALPGGQQAVAHAAAAKQTAEAAAAGEEIKAAAAAVQQVAEPKTPATKAQSEIVPASEEKV